MSDTDEFTQNTKFKKTMRRVLLGFILLMVLAIKAVGQDTDTGFGCYDLENNECSCDEEVCNEEGCDAVGGMYTDQCSSCQCGVNDGSTEDDDVDESGSNSTSSEQEKEWFGCYNLPDVGRSCTCTEDVCSEATCTGTLQCDGFLLNQLC
jgi:hypothetical protein